MTTTQTQTRILWILLLIGFSLRLLQLFASDPWLAYEITGGDSLWYMSWGYGLTSGMVDGVAPYPNGLGFHNAAIPSAPLFLILTGHLQHLLGQYNAVIAIRVIHIIAGTATCLYVFDIARWLAKDARAGLLACGVLAISPSLISEVDAIMTETLYIFFTMTGFWFYTRLRQYTSSFTNIRIIMIGVAFALATLTRAIFILYPVGFVCLIFIVYRQNWRQAIRFVGLFMLTYVLINSTWTYFNYRADGDIILGSDQLSAVIWRGAVTNDATPAVVDEIIGDSTYEAEFIETVQSDIIGYVQLRMTELGYSILRPYAHIFFKGELVSITIGNFLRDLSPTGFINMITTPYFIPKIFTYLLHYSALISGLLALWFLRHLWQTSFVLYGFIAYTLLLHLVILALPRYIFPIYPVLWSLGAMIWVNLWDKMKLRFNHRFSSQRPTLV